MKHAAALIFLLAWTGCSDSRQRFSVDTIALIDGRPVMLSAFRAYFDANAGRPIAESSPKVVSALFDQFLREEIWRSAANLHGSDAAAERQEAPALLLARAGASVSPSESEVRAEYDAHPERFMRPAQARVRRISTPEKAGAEKARARVLAGEDFAEVARAVSRAPDASRGGEMGFVERGDLPSEFENAIFGLKTGQLTPVLPADEGYLVFELEEKSPARRLSFEEAAPGIRRMLSREKAEKSLRLYLESARREGRVRVFIDRLPFVYAGEFFPAGGSDG